VRGRITAPDAESHKLLDHQVLEAPTAQQASQEAIHESKSARPRRVRGRITAPDADPYRLNDHRVLEAPAAQQASEEAIQQNESKDGPISLTSADSEVNKTSVTMVVVQESAATSPEIPMQDRNEVNMDRTVPLQDSLTPGTDAEEQPSVRIGTSVIVGELDGGDRCESPDTTTFPEQRKLKTNQICTSTALLHLQQAYGMMNAEEEVLEETAPPIVTPTINGQDDSGENCELSGSTSPQQIELGMELMCTSSPTEDDIAASLQVKDETAAALVAQAELLLIELESVQDDDAVVQPVSDRSPLAAPDASAPETNAAVPNLNELQMPAELITALPNELIMTVEAPFADPKSEDMQLPLISKDSGINETCSAAPECAASSEATISERTEVDLGMTATITTLPIDESSPIDSEDVPVQMVNLKIDGETDHCDSEVAAPTNAGSGITFPQQKDDLKKERNAICTSIALLALQQVYSADTDSENEEEDVSMALLLQQMATLAIHAEIAAGTDPSSEIPFPQQIESEMEMDGIRFCAVATLIPPQQVSTMEVEDEELQSAPTEVTPAMHGEVSGSEDVIMDEQATGNIQSIIPVIAEPQPDPASQLHQLDQAATSIATEEKNSMAEEETAMIATEAAEVQQTEMDITEIESQSTPLDGPSVASDTLMEVDSELEAEAWSASKEEGHGSLCDVRCPVNEVEALKQQAASLPFTQPRVILLPANVGVACKEMVTAVEHAERSHPGPRTLRQLCHIFLAEWTPPCLPFFYLREQACSRVRFRGSSTCTSTLRRWNTSSSAWMATPRSSRPPDSLQFAAGTITRCSTPARQWIVPIFQNLVLLLPHFETSFAPATGQPARPHLW
jgi:hypothetical protein